MRGIDSLSNYPTESSTNKKPWDILSSDSDDWGNFGSFEDPKENSTFNQSRPLDYPDDWSKLDLPYEASETLAQGANTSEPQMSEEEARKANMSNEQRGQSILDELDKLIQSIK